MATGAALFGVGGVAGVLLLAAATVCLTSGCSTLGYYAQAANGHLDLLQSARPVQHWIDDPATPPALRERLLLSQRLRDFAVAELKLPDNDSYRRHADLNRSAAVWNAVAAPELGLALKTWCFPVLGCVGYRGYYTQLGAQTLATQLQADGWETQVYGVPAYSTLGWSNWVGGDPLLNTFINWAEPDLARLIFHELAHQVAYAQDDTTFNESFATAVERIGSRRWLQQHGTPDMLAAQALNEQRQGEFRRFTLRWRGELDALYRGDGSAADKRQRKAELMQQMRDEYTAMKTRDWGGYSGYDGWFARANNAAFAVQAAYNELVPAFERLFERSGSDFTRFYAEVQRLAALPRDQRRATLAATP
ncbi:MAG: aminopeptidase [Rubrivivax sp.]|nr:aminopeptidase [Rubrivivax sp.]